MTMRFSSTLICRTVPSVTPAVGVVTVGRTSVGFAELFGERVWPTPTWLAGMDRPSSVIVSARTTPSPRGVPRTETRSPRRMLAKPEEPVKISGLPAIIVPNPRYCVETESVSTVLRA
jgi:hypothetical protein